MGLFDFLGKNKDHLIEKNQIKRESVRKEAIRSNDNRLQNILNDSDNAIKECQQADAQFEKDGNIEQIISVYEKHFTERSEWSSFNFNMRLAKLYVKAGRNSDAWGYLNKMALWAMMPDAINMSLSKIRFEQFKILKAEKKYEDALTFLVFSYVDRGNEIKGVFNKKKFLTDAKTTAKKAGLSEDDLGRFADDLEQAIQKEHIKEQDVKSFCSERLF